MEEKINMIHIITGILTALIALLIVLLMQKWGTENEEYKKGRR